MAKAVVWSVSPSPNDQFHVTPVAEELTLKTTGVPVVALAGTFKNTNGGDGVGGLGVGVGLGFGGGGVEVGAAATTSV